MDTKYSGYSLNELHALFSTEQWNSLSFSDRVNACQEVENRYAAENNVKPCTITFQPMDGRYYGWQSGDRITLNSHMLSDGQFVIHYADENGIVHEARIDVLAPGWNTLDTVYHEGTHGVQEKTGNMPNTYINPDMDQDLYRIQAIEKQAYAQGQLRTLEAMQTYEKESGKLDSDHDDYLASVRNDSFQSALADAAKHYNDPNIEKTVNDVIYDRDAGIVRDNPSESYKAINELCNTYGVNASRSNSQTAENNSEAQYNQGSQSNENRQPGNENNSGIKYLTDEEAVDDGLKSTVSSKDAAENKNPGMNGSSTGADNSTDGSAMNDGLGDDFSSETGIIITDDGLGNDFASITEGGMIDDGLGEGVGLEEGNTQEADDGLESGSSQSGGEDSSDVMDID